MTFKEWMVLLKELAIAILPIVLLVVSLWYSKGADSFYY